MSNTNTGGPAFPTEIRATNGGIGFDNDELMPGATTHYSGMTLRDYFAAKAMASVIARGDDTNRPGMAEWSYAMADTMLKERNK